MRHASWWALPEREKVIGATTRAQRASSRAEKVPLLEPPCCVHPHPYISSRETAEASARQPRFRLIHTRKWRPPAGDAGTCAFENPHTRKHSLEEVTAADEATRLESHSLSRHIQTEVSDHENINVLAQLSTDLRGRLDREEENSAARHKQSQATFDILQSKLAEPRNRTVGLS